MNFRIQSDLDKQMLLTGIEQFLDKGKWYSFPKSFVGNVNGSKITIRRVGGRFSWIGRGRFDGYVQDLSGKRYIVGQLNSKRFAVGLGIAISLLLVAMMGSEKHSQKSIWDYLVAGSGFPLLGYFIVTWDHFNIKRSLIRISEGK